MSPPLPPAPERLSRALNIILVEDDDGDAKAVLRAFARARIANPILRFRDGLEALAFLRGETGTPPETYVILADIKMPRMTGLELVAEIRRDPNLRQAIVFIMTTSGDERDKFEAYAQNIAGYILKNRAGADFLDLVGTLDHYWRVIELPRMPPPGAAS
ncbi:response regulator [Pseudooceanicola sp. CBS1P-1]|uniref:Response regulator n=1 Tax=Pseudooceanicola albus TaxID=2692189 RepID=A0A6L7FVX3_9RHOB|nr:MULTISPECIES: response regulator [Pseudooceanicola]MBT9383424.1 response regulator [Pseudooceanicola endophyticus]MXN16254.1 response regulator [Pseudooceanicola albus]